MPTTKVAPTAVTSATALAGTVLFEAMGTRLTSTVLENTVMYQAT